MRNQDYCLIFSLWSKKQGCELERSSRSISKNSFQPLPKLSFKWIKSDLEIECNNDRWIKQDARNFRNANSNHLNENMKIWNRHNHEIFQSRNLRFLFSNLILLFQLAGPTHNQFNTTREERNRVNSVQYNIYIYIYKEHKFHEFNLDKFLTRNFDRGVETA